MTVLCRNQLVGFPVVLGRWNDLEIVRDVKTADDATSKRHDVVDVVLDAGFTADASALLVNRPHSVQVAPWRRGPNSVGVALHSSSGNNRWISSLVRAITCAQVFSIPLSVSGADSPNAIFIRAHPFRVLGLDLSSALSAVRTLSSQRLLRIGCSCGVGQFAFSWQVCRAISAHVFALFPPSLIVGHARINYTAESAA